MIKSPVPEHSVLKPLPPTSKDADSWPIFRLDNVEIYTTDHRGRCFPAELWRATVSHPVTVEGTLRPLPSELHHAYVNPASRQSTSAKGQRVKIEQCIYWSYGQYDDGIVAWWAAGDAGWFELKPAASYRPMYKRMKQAIELLYFIADLHRDHLKRAGNGVAKRRASLAQMTVERLFAEFAKEPKHKGVGQKAVADRFLDHGEVLITLMKTGREAAGWAWEDTKVFAWLIENVSPAASSPASPLADSNDEDAMSTSTGSSSHPRVSGKGRSSLRPKLSPATGSHRGRTRSTTIISDEDTVMAEVDDSVGAPSNSHKRKSSTAVHARRPGRPPKRISTSGLSTSQLPSPPSDSTSSEDPRNSIPLPILDHLPPQQQSKQRDARTPGLRLVTAPLPTFEPTPGTDTWHCPLDGCATTYYGVAVQPGVRDMIREHYAEHAVESQRQIDLVFAEERPYLPVGNLLRRIKGLVAEEQKRNEQRRESNSDNEGTTKPKPIVRRY